MLDTGSVTLIDVREPSEFAEGHIPGSINIPIRTLGENLDQIPTDQPVVLSCASGLRASLATAALHVLGYGNARSFPPSFKGWSSAEMPIAK
ncbi:MAG: rhodanese-like domain-containing protein [Oscillochloris sp.]|nr:rhodanese-like domain-containing protein [Oscillochloris sp.]